MITINYRNGWYIISDDKGNQWKYLYYSKRAALQRFKDRFGYRNKRGIIINDRSKANE